MRRILTVVLMMAAICMAACGSQKSAVTQTTIEAMKNGAIVHTIVEDFTEEYYNLEELRDMISSSCSSYNQKAGSERVIMESMELEDGILSVVMRYKNSEDYSEFNGLPMFSGTIQEAVKEGYNLDVKLYPADGGDISIGKTELLEMKNRHLLILREEVDVRMWDEVLYHSSNVMDTKDSDRVQVMSQDRLAYIVFR